MLEEFDKKFLNKDILNIAGCDEAGRGPLAGPVVVGACIMPLDKEFVIDGVNDSKKLSEKKREMLFDKIVSTAKCFSIVEIDNKTIDEINILNATKFGMVKAINGLSVKPDLVLVDAVKNLDIKYNQIGIIKGDAQSYNIACASILAKVYRDRLMKELDKKYPVYQFAKHKGYGTKLHIQLLKENGKCEIHRNTFIKHFVD